MEKAGPRYTLISCSLVCRYWGNRCREHMFRGAILRINSMHDAQLFRKYSTAGCPKLISVCSLIACVNVRMDYRTPGLSASFLHVLHFPEVNSKLGELVIFGPMPKSVPPCKLDSPHCDLSAMSIPPPSVTSYTNVTIFDIAFPSFRHVVKYFSHFKDASRIVLSGITWDSKAPELLANFVKPVARYRRRMEVSARRCTNDLWLCLQVVMMYPDFPLRRVTSTEQYWAITTMNLIREFFNKAPKAKDRDDELSSSLNSCRSLSLRLLVGKG